MATHYHSIITDPIMTDHDKRSQEPNRRKNPTRLERQKARMRMWQFKAQQATEHEGEVKSGFPRKRPKPSMPPLPWDKSE